MEKNCTSIDHVLSYGKGPWKKYKKQHKENAPPFKLTFKLKLTTTDLIGLLVVLSISLQSVKSQRSKSLVLVPEHFNTFDGPYCLQCLNKTHMATNGHKEIFSGTKQESELYFFLTYKIQVQLELNLFPMQSYDALNIVGSTFKTHIYYMIHEMK